MIAPVAYIPAAMGNSTATVTTPGLEKPLSSSSTGASFKVIAAVKVPMNTIQAGIFPQTRSAIMAASKATINHASVVIMKTSIEYNPKQVTFGQNTASTGILYASR